MITEFETIEVETETIVAVPESLTERHEYPIITTQTTYEELESATLHCVSELKACNKDKQSIRDLRGNEQ